MAGAPEGAGTVPASPFEKIKARRAVLAKRKTLDLVIPGYSDQVGVRYGILPEEELQEWAERLVRAQRGDEEGSQTAVDVAIGLILRAQQCAIVRNGEGTWEPLRPDGAEDDDPPLGLDMALGDQLALEADNPRAVVRAMFSPEGVNPLAPMAHGEAIVAWLQGRAEQIDGVLLGE